MYTWEELEQMYKPIYLYIPRDIYDDIGYSLNNPVWYSPCEEVRTDDFHLRDVEKKFICKNCGNDKFEVGTGLYFTCIKCPSCKWERCIHEG